MKLVIIIPGVILPIQIFLPFTSWDRASVKYVTPLLAVPYILNLSIIALLEPCPSTLYICPYPCLIIILVTIFEQIIVPFKSMSIILLISLLLSSHIYLSGWFTPALLIHISIVPSSLIISLTTLLTSSSLVTSNFFDNIFGSRFRESNSVLAFFNSSSFTSSKTTLQLFCKNSFVISYPNPLALPVIATVFILFSFYFY